MKVSLWAYGVPIERFLELKYFLWAYSVPLERFINENLSKGILYIHIVYKLIYFTLHYRYNQPAVDPYHTYYQQAQQDQIYYETAADPLIAHQQPEAQLPAPETMPVIQYIVELHVLPLYIYLA